MTDITIIEVVYDPTPLTVEAALDVAPQIVELEIDADLDIIEVVSEGIQGPPGQQGIPSEDKRYEHVQLIASDTWTVNHNLGVYPSVSVLSPGRVEVLTEVVHVSSNQVVVHFISPQTGFVQCT